MTIVHSSKFCALIRIGAVQAADSAPIERIEREGQERVGSPYE